MAAKKYTVMIIPNNSSGTRRFGLSRRLLFVFLLFLVSLIGFSSYLGYDRFQLEQDLARLEPLLARVHTQRQVMERLGERLQDLDKNLVKLRKFEEQIRIMASLKPSDRRSDFGVGGVTKSELPESLDKLLPSERRLIGRLNRQFLDIERRTSLQERAFDEVVRALRSKQVLLAHTPSILPVKGWLTSGFGYRESAFTGRREFHAGIDIVARVGSPVIAPADGVVITARRESGYGNTVELRHVQGIVTRFAHLKKYLVKVGQSVKRGDVIAHVGSTGRSTGPHLHYEVRLNGVAVNPLLYIVEDIAKR